MKRLKHALPGSNPAPLAPIPPVVQAPPTPPPEPQSPEQATQDVIALPTLAWRAGLRPNSDTLFRTRGRSVYKEMLADDQVTACIGVDLAYVKERRYWFAVADEDTQGDARDFLTEMFKSVTKGGMPALLEELHTAKMFGHAEVEKVHGPRTVLGKTRWCLLDGKLRAPWSFELAFDDYGNITVFQQRQAAGKILNLDPRDFIHYAYNGKYDNGYGYSALRAAYPDYAAKRITKRMWDVHLERGATGFPHAQMKKDLPPDQYATLVNAIRNINIQTGLITGDQVVIDWHNAPSVSDAFKLRLEEQNKGIARAMLLPTHIGMAEQGTKGANSQAKTHDDVMGTVVTAFLKELAAVLQDQCINEIVYWNFGPDVTPPQLCFEEVDDMMKAALAPLWTNALEGRAIRWTEQDEAAYRDLVHMPAYSEDDDPNAGAEPDQSPYGALPPTNPLSDASGTDNPNQDEPPAKFAAPRARWGRWTAEQRTDVPGLRAVFSQVDSSLASNLSNAAQQLAASSRAQLKPGARLQVPEAWRKTLQVKVKSNLQATYAAGAKSARDELAKARGKQAHALSPLTLPEYIDTLAFNLTEDLGEDVVSIMRRVWARALQEDWPVQRLTDELDSALQGYSAPDAPRIATIVRTTNTSAFNLARKQVFEDPALGGFVEAYEFAALLDDRTTDVCEWCDGRTYPVDDPFWDVYTPPNHFNCRSLLIPVVQGDEWEESNAPGKSAPKPSPGF